jgi:hypothetical protein
MSRSEEFHTARSNGNTLKYKTEDGIHPDLAARLNDDPRLQPGHPRYIHSGVDRMMVEGQHGDEHRTWMAGEPARRAEALKGMMSSGQIRRGKPETDPRLDRSSEHYLHSGVDRMMVDSWHAGN